MPAEASVSPNLGAVVSVRGSVVDLRFEEQRRGDPCGRCIDEELFDVIAGFEALSGTQRDQTS